MHSGAPPSMDSAYKSVSSNTRLIPTPVLCCLPRLIGNTGPNLNASYHAIDILLASKIVSPAILEEYFKEMPCVPNERLPASL